ncbi:MAG TPA: hypothetical protein VGM54_07685 [Chthoniobacter sp.]|jgi:hypothetical protein
MNSNYLQLAALEHGGHIESALIGIVVMAVLGFLMRGAQKETLVVIGSRRKIEHSQRMRTFVILGWVFTAGLALLAAFTARGGNVKPAVLVVALFGALFLPLHVETFGASITWDETNIYTRSPWRRRRTVPFTAVKSCDFSPVLQWYRIHTDGHGIVRLHAYMTGIPGLLRMLPCASPPYPPNVPMP